MHERRLERPPGYPPGARPGDDEGLDRHVRSRYAYDIERIAPAGPETPALAVAAAAVAARIARVADGLVFDPSCGMLLTLDEVEDVAAAGEVPVGKLVNVHLIEGPDGIWVHTHGAVKLGLPEVETFGVHPARASEAGQALYKVLERWVRDGSGDAGTDIDLANGVARTVFAPRGSSRPAWARCGEEPSRRIALVNAADGGDLSPILSRQPADERDFPISQRGEAQALIAALRPRLASPELEVGESLPSKPAAPPPPGPKKPAWLVEQTKAIEVEPPPSPSVPPAEEVSRLAGAPALTLPEGVRLLVKLAIESEAGVELGWIAVDRWAGELMSGEMRPGERREWHTEAVLAVLATRNGIPLTSAEVAKLGG